jgi:hypothetical protein
MMENAGSRLERLETLMNEAGLYMAQLTERLDSAERRLRKLERPSGAEPTPKTRNGGEPSARAETSPEECYVVGREVLPRSLWNQAQSFFAFARLLYALDNEGTWPKGSAELIAYLKPKKADLERSGAGLLHAWEWGSANGDGLLRKAGLADRPSIKHWFGATFWALKRAGVPTDTILRTFENQEFLDDWAAKVSMVKRNTNFGRYFITISTVEWFINHGLARRPKG